MNRLQRAIQEQIEKVIIEGGKGHNTNPLWCLQSARFILEPALGLDDKALYSTLCTTRVNGDYRRTSWWASDFEASLKKRGYALPRGTTPEVGDIVFGADPAPEGHVGILFLPRGASELHVFENTSASRGRRIKGALRITPFSEWDRVTTHARLPESLMPPLPNPSNPAWPIHWVEVWNGNGPTGEVYGLAVGPDGKRKLFRVTDAKRKAAEAAWEKQK